MILQHLEIKEESVGYSGYITVRVGNDKMIQVVFGNDEVVELMQAAQFVLLNILRFSPGYAETFLPKQEVADGT